MNLIEFIEKFPNEESCKTHFVKQRMKKEVISKKCGDESYYWLKNKEQFECKKCRFRTTLRSGPVIHSSNLPFRYWYIAIHLLTATKKGFSAHELKRQLGHKRYQPIWEMLKKIRIKMGEAESVVLFDGMVEIDDAYISTATSKKEKKNLKR